MRALALAGALLALALPLAGCGASGSSNASRATPQSAPTGQPPQIDRQAFSKLRACLKRHGVTLPSGAPQGQPGQGQQPTLDAKTQKAIQACSQYLPSQPQGGFRR
jgi:hypothetical protein